MILRTILSLFLLFQAWLPIMAFAATEFTITVKSSGGDATSLSVAESIADEDLTVASIKAFSISAASSPTLVDGEIVVGVTSAATGVCVHVNAALTQVLIKTIVGTFQSGEVVKKSTDAAVTVTLSNAGDSPIVGIALYSMNDTTAVTIAGGTPSATNYVYIYTPTSERHSGTWNTGKYYLTASVSGDGVLIISQAYTRVSGLQVKNTNGSPATNEAAIRITSAASSVWIDSTITQGGRLGIRAESATATKIWNVVSYGASVAAVGIGGSGVIDIYSSTAIAPTNGVSATSSSTAKNVYGSGTTAFSGGVVITTCASSDTTGSAGLQSIAYSTANFTNVTAGSENLHLVTGSALINVGTDTSAEAAPLNFTTDFDNPPTTRSGTWDIGADDFGSTAVPVFMHHYFQLMGE